MSYKKIETLCLSSEVQYKEAKATVHKIYRDWYRKGYEEQAADFDSLLPILLKVAQHKSRLSNYILDRFLKEIADWGDNNYWKEVRWGAKKIKAQKNKLIDFVKTMLQTIKREKTKMSDTLRSHLFRFIANVLLTELRPDFLSILEDGMMVMNTNEQFFALDGLHHYYSWNGTFISRESVDKLDKIITTTTARLNAANAKDVKRDAARRYK